MTRQVIADLIRRRRLRTLVVANKTLVLRSAVENFNLCSAPKTEEQEREEEIASRVTACASGLHQPLSRCVTTQKKRLLAEAFSNAHKFALLQQTPVRLFFRFLLQHHR